MGAALLSDAAFNIRKQGDIEWRDTLAQVVNCVAAKA
jgi:hypothetical protein